MGSRVNRALRKSEEQDLRRSYRGLRKRYRYTQRTRVRTFIRLLHRIDGSLEILERARVPPMEFVPFLDDLGRKRLFFTSTPFLPPVRHVALSNEDYVTGEWFPDE